MDILEVGGQNFLTLGKFGPLNLNSRGLVLIRGENNDDPSALSNGAGKSSVGDAVSWCLYGETARGESGDSVINRFAKKNCNVRVVLRDVEVIYTIQRFRKDAECKNQTLIYGYADLAAYEGRVSPVPLHKGTEKETQEVINKIVGCDHEVFKAAIYAGQEQMPDLPGMTDRNLKILIEQAAGIERIEDAYQHARSRLMDEKGKLAVVQGKVDTIKGTLERTKTQIELVKLRRGEFEANRPSRVKTVQDELDAAHSRLTETRAQYDAYRIEAELDAIDGKLSDELAAVRPAFDALVIADRAVSIRDAGFNTKIKALKSLVEDRERMIRSVANAAEEIKKPCSECGKPHDPSEITEWTLHQETKIAEIRETESTMLAELIAAKAELDAEKAAVHLQRKALPDTTAIEARRTILNKDRRNKATVLSSIKGIEADIAMLTASKASIVEEVNPHEAVIASLGGSLKSVMEDGLKLVTEKTRLEARLAILEDTVKVFGPSGVRAHILDTITPFLNERTSEYLGILSDGNIYATWQTLTKSAKGELKEKFSIDVGNDKGAESFGGLSGGEKRKVRIATMLALQDLVASRAIKPISFYMADEIDDALDTAGLERLMAVLDRKAREKGTVLVISHNELRDAIDQVTTVTKTGGYSTVTGALAEV